MDETPVVSVIVPARDAAATIGRAVDALLAQDLHEPFEIVVVDNGSRDDTAAIAAGRGSRVRLVDSRAAAARGAGGDLSAAAARNAGLQVARAPVVAFTDADCFPVRGWLRAGLAAMESADLVQGPVVPDPGAPRGAFDRTLDFPGPTAWFPTANLFVRRALVDAAGGFVQVGPDADRSGEPLGEDTLLAWTVQRAGGRAAFAADAVVHHAVFPRRARDYVLYTRRWRRLPEVVRAVPELRREHLVARVFLERRTLLFDVASAGLLVAALGGRRARAGSSVAILPYLALLVRESQCWPGVPATRFVAARAAADAVAAVALVAGSVRARTPVI